MIRFNINVDASIDHVNRLKGMHKSSFPNAVRGTLNKAAFHAKQKEIPKSADQSFINRSPNFFKAHSRVEMAKGWDLSQMRSTVGMTSQGLKGGNNYAVQDLEQQEHGGIIKSRSFIPMKTARSGKSNARPVRPGNRLSNIKKVVNASNVKGKTGKESFVKSALVAGDGGFVLTGDRKKTLFKINTVGRRRVKGKNLATKVKATPLYSYQENRNVKVTKTHFMKRAALETRKKMGKFFITEAHRQFNKIR